MRARNRLSGMRILRAIACWRLEAEGALVMAAPTGRAALDIAAVTRFDVGLTDLGLPDMTGTTVVAGLRSIWGDAGTIAVVTGAGHHDLAGALRLGADRFFVKPVDWNSLVLYLTSRTAARLATTP
jgi:two-component system, OmpR family, KDP operon response regulator KdpE